MADILGSFAEGFQRGRAQFAANEAARAEEAEKRRKAALEDAKFQLQVAGESRLAQGAAETAWSEIDKAINDENWDPSKINQARSAAMRFDQTYGNIWKGGSALKHVEESLHLGPQKVSGAVEDGKQGPPAPDTETKHPLWGYVTPEQKMAADERSRKLVTNAIAGKIRPMAMSELEKTRGADGLYDADKAYQVLSQLEADMHDGGEYDEPTVQAVFDDIWQGIADMNKMRLEARSAADGGMSGADLGVASNRLSGWLRASMGLDNNSMNFEAMFQQKAPMVLEIEEFMGHRLMAGAHEPTIKIEVLQRFRNRIGDWELNPDALKWARALAGGPRGLVPASNAVLNSGVFPDPSGVVPVYNSEANEGYLVDKTTGGAAQFWPPAPGIEMAPPPVDVPGLLRAPERKAAAASVKTPESKPGTGLNIPGLDAFGRVVSSLEGTGEAVGDALGDVVGAPARLVAGYKNRRED
jgi:hypothetical protein